MNTNENQEFVFVRVHLWLGYSLAEDPKLRMAKKDDSDPSPSQAQGRDF
jgi:hypothetical protein